MRDRRSRLYRFLLLMRWVADIMQLDLIDGKDDLAAVFELQGNPLSGQFSLVPAPRERPLPSPRRCWRRS